MEADAMWRVVGDEGRRLEAFAEDIQATARTHALEPLRAKLRDVRATLRQLDILFSALDR